jgi:hypothetical protein
MTIITPQVARGLALARAAESMLRTLGGQEVAVRFAAPTASTAEFGIPSSTTTDVPISPAVVRNAGVPGTSRAATLSIGAPPVSPADGIADNALEFLFPATTVEPAAQQAGYSSVPDWFAAALGLVFNGALRPIASVATENFAGQAYLYRVTTAT